MVRRWGPETGKTRIGCLFSLFLFVSAIYYGIQYFEVYFRYYRMQDEVKTQAQFAPTLSDDVIRRRLVARADTLGLPLGTRQWDIRRSANPREILIHAEYDDSVAIELPGYTKVIRFHFTPGARVPL
ncbi:MAG: hypothetical protein HYR48_04510 [Gemmatimonadetes bacterium]|nr:hypothetical protein [Gemmatimonadota bacterium]